MDDWRHQSPVHYTGFEKQRCTDPQAHDFPAGRRFCGTYPRKDNAVGNTLFFHRFTETQQQIVSGI